MMKISGRYVAAGLSALLAMSAVSVSAHMRVGIPQALPRGAIVQAACANTEDVDTQTGETVRLCCCEVKGEIACRSDARCAELIGSCLARDWGICHFTSLNNPQKRQ